MNTERLDHEIAAIERELLRDDPALGARFALLDQVERRHDATVFTLLVASAVFLMVGLATMSTVAWVVGVISLLASLSVDTRHERKLRHAEVGRSRRLAVVPVRSEQRRSR